MKKILSVILFSFTTVSAIFAQSTPAKKKLDWGITTGLNISNLRISNGADADWKTGLVTGVYFNIKTGDKLGIQPQFLYSSMGGKNIVVNNGSSLRLNYFSLPVLLKYKIKKSFALVVGPQVDVLISAKTKNSSNQFNKVTDNYKENSFNGTAGFQFWPSHCFGFTARYIFGFNNINSTNTTVGGVNLNPELKNQGVQIAAALKL